MAEPVLTEVRRLKTLPGYRLTWSDGHSAEFADAYLRGWCPCALCQGHDNVEIVFHAPLDSGLPVRIDRREHDDWGWFTLAEAIEKIRWTDDRASLLALTTLDRSS